MGAIFCQHTIEKIKLSYACLQGGKTAIVANDIIGDRQSCGTTGLSGEDGLCLGT